VLPNDGDLFFMTDKPYLPEATLLEVIAEPRHPDTISLEAARKALLDVGLAHLAPQLATTALWGRELGIEDQQRIGFARLLVHQPRWILTRDASSALSQEAETALFKTIREALPHAILITMTHRAMAAWMFNRRIALSTSAPVPGQGANTTNECTA
jgi:putative ATP-binding cassette transporter